MRKVANRTKFPRTFHLKVLVASGSREAIAVASYTCYVGFPFIFPYVFPVVLVVISRTSDRATPDQTVVEYGHIGVVVELVQGLGGGVTLMRERQTR